MERKTRWTGPDSSYKFPAVAYNSGGKKRMAIAVVVILLAVGSILFHFLSPWWFTEIASNWSAMDETLMITFVITGIVFAAVSGFMAYSIIKYRHKEGSKAVYEPENNKLEWWLTGLTSVGVVIMLAPGLIVWADYVTVPENAIEIEAVGQQWKWSYRYPGEDGAFGKVDTRLISAKNPFGIDPDDANGQDDILSEGSDLHLPLNQPVKMLLRSKDVLHDFYVPQFRAKMDLIPGLISYFWLEPTRTGRFDVLCAELCGVGHYNMRSHVVVEEAAAFEAWLATQTTFAQSMEPDDAGDGDPLVAMGRLIADEQGCVACHSLDGSAGLGPTWKGLFGRSETMADGTIIVVDEAYLRESILTPDAKIVQGFSEGLMPPYEFTDEEIEALIALSKTLVE